MPPGWSPPPPGSVPPRRKRDAFADFRGRTWWELVLILLPAGLLPIGGFLGGACGVAGLAVNVWIAKKSLSAGSKVFAMIGVVLVSYLIFFMFATLWYVFVNRPTGSPV
jgi:hypothetical protein